MSPLKLMLNDYYSCKFTAVFQSWRSNHLRVTGEDFLELKLIAANALFEMHRVAEARDLLASDAGEELLTSSVGNYLVGRIHYLDSAYEQALEKFEQSLALASTSKTKTRAMLGIANTVIELGRFEEARNLIPQIASLLDQHSSDDMICLKAISASLALRQSQLELAISTYKEALKLANQEGWTYWIIRSFYALAKCYRIAGRKSDAGELVRTVEYLINGTECAYLRSMVGQEFGEFLNFSDRIYLDRKKATVKTADKFADFSNSPLLFQFISFVALAKRPVSKEEVSQALWSSEKYQPEIHDKRIFNITNRLRAAIEVYSSQPILLLSSRVGFRLSVQVEFTD